MSINSLHDGFAYSRLTDAGTKENAKWVGGLAGGSLIMITGIALAIIIPLLFTRVIPTPGLRMFAHWPEKILGLMMGLVISVPVLGIAMGGIDMMRTSDRHLTRELSTEEQALFIKPQSPSLENRIDPFYSEL